MFELGKLRGGSAFSWCARIGISGYATYIYKGPTMPSLIAGSCSNTRVSARSFDRASYLTNYYFATNAATAKIRKFLSLSHNGDKKHSRIIF